VNLNEKVKRAGT